LTNLVVRASIVVVVVVVAAVATSHGRGWYRR
jgi:hypothetical protein